MQVEAKKLNIVGSFMVYSASGSPVGEVILFKIEGGTFATFACETSCGSWLPVSMPDQVRCCWFRVHLLTIAIKQQYGATLLEMRGVTNGS